MADRKITLNKTFTVDLAGDSIWDKDKTINPASVEVTGITLESQIMVMVTSTGMPQSHMMVPGRSTQIRDSSKGSWNCWVLVGRETSQNRECRMMVLPILTSILTHMR